MYLEEKHEKRRSMFVLILLEPPTLLWGVKSPMMKFGDEILLSKSTSIHAVTAGKLVENIENKHVLFV